MRMAREIAPLAASGTENKAGESTPAANFAETQRRHDEEIASKWPIVGAFEISKSLSRQAKLIRMATSY